MQRSACPDDHRPVLNTVAHVFLRACVYMCSPLFKWKDDLWRRWSLFGSWEEKHFLRWAPSVWASRELTVFHHAHRTFITESNWQHFRSLNSRPDLEHVGRFSLRLRKNGPTTEWDPVTKQQTARDARQNQNHCGLYCTFQKLPEDDRDTHLSPSTTFTSTSCGSAPRCKWLRVNWTFFISLKIKRLPPRSGMLIRSLTGGQ